MQITDVQINKLISESDSTLKGYASIIIDGGFSVHGIRIVQGRDGQLFVGFPSRKRKDGGRDDIAHPTNNVIRDQIQEAVLAKYNEFAASVDHAASKQKA